MKNEFDQDLSSRLASLRELGLLRELRQVDSPQSTHIHIGGQLLLNFSSNDYLGLANHPPLKDAAKAAIEQFGAGTGASRLICGSLTPYHQLEEALAQFKATAAALSFSTGYATALGTIGAVLEKDDVVIIDKLVHASIVDAARLCGAKLRVFAHNDLNDLETILKWTDARQGQGNPSRPAPTTGVVESIQSILPSARKPRVLIITESVFSMDGDFAPLREIVALKEKYGAWLMLDEAHATGLFGLHRRGWAEACGVSDRIEIQMGTLGKALGAAGGFICGSQPLIDWLVNRARSFIFSTAPVPAAAAAATAAIRFVQSQEGKTRCAQLWARVDQLRSGLATGPWALPAEPSAILPLILGESAKAVQMANQLRNLGLFVPAIRYPTVARDQARLRLTVTAGHAGEDVEQLLSALSKCVQSDE